MMLSFQQLHTILDDRSLDALAARCGWNPPVGRLTFTGDRILDHLGVVLREREVERVLDLGCGRGFLGRWLAARHPKVRYAGVDASAAALAAARTLLPHAKLVQADYRRLHDLSYDAVTIIDALFADRIDDAHAERLVSLARRGGTIFLASTMISDRQAECFLSSTDAFERLGCAVATRDWTDTVRDAVRVAAIAWIDWPAWPAPAIDILRSEATTLLAAIDSGAFHYMTLDVRATRNGNLTPSTTG